MFPEQAKIERVRELFDLPAMYLEIEIDLAEQYIRESEAAPPSQCEIESELREALTEAAELTLVIAYALTNPALKERQRMELAKAKCAVMGINAFGIMDDPAYDPKTRVEGMGVHFN